MREQRAKLRRLLIWFCVNFIIFIVCYLNYRLQLKHRHLYRTLNVGLCFSRAAAMIINFNLLLVWIPMCKYSLTRLAFRANNLSNRLKRARNQRQKDKLAAVASSSPLVLIDLSLTKQHHPDLSICHKLYQPKKHTKLSSFERKFKQSLVDAFDQLGGWLYEAKLNFINSFLIAVDHCTSLHTICATTITIASVIHTVAHLMNVINFSKNYDPLLSNLNMAEYKGQNPFQLLVSVPGITGCLMVIILILMSLSSTDIIRNSSYDLFQIFHRLSIIFVFLLFLHPSSHVLKEQSNVDRHHPELCHINGTTPLESTTTQLQQQLIVDSSLKDNNNLISWPQHALSSQLIRPPLSTYQAAATSGGSGHNKTTISGSDNQGHHRQQHRRSSGPSMGTDSATNHHNYRHLYDDFLNNNKTDLSSNNHDTTATNIKVNESMPPLKVTNVGGGSQIDERFNASELERAQSSFTYNNNNNDQQPPGNRLLCLDPRPLFVAQSSICWYVLSIGLSCYLFDLILRKWRRSKSSIQLLDARLDGEGNLIELILSNNHKRFSQWLPGQFVYLNCPQLAAYEWHPFTISSMDNRSRQFTLHIKTGGDWTRKLREKLESQKGDSGNSMSLMGECYYVSSLSMPPVEFGQNLPKATSGNLSSNNNDHGENLNTEFNTSHMATTTPVQIGSILPDFNCYNRIGKLQVECTKVAQIKPNNNICNVSSTKQQQQQQNYSCGHLEDFGGVIVKPNLHKQLYSIVCNHSKDMEKTIVDDKLNLYIDGPFHSPFERLLEQQVSVCIANGVGWTAFSSTFQCITNRYAYQRQKDAAMAAGGQASDWWWKWRDFAIRSTPTTTCRMNEQQAEIIRKLSDTNLHLMVIVTSIEQLRPFYDLAQNYFKQIKDECQIAGAADPVNPVREITAFITRSTKEDNNVKRFCDEEKLILMDKSMHHNQMIRVNEVFTIEFGKPQFDCFLNAFNVIYSSSQKVSVYCCGSYQVKKTVRDICQRLNKASARKGPVYSYHEENF